MSRKKKRKHPLKRRQPHHVARTGRKSARRRARSVPSAPSRPLLIRRLRSWIKALVAATLRSAAGLSRVWRSGRESLRKNLGLRLAALVHTVRSRAAAWGAALRSRLKAWIRSARRRGGALGRGLHAGSGRWLRALRCGRTAFVQTARGWVAPLWHALRPGLSAFARAARAGAGAAGQWLRARLAPLRRALRPHIGALSRWLSPLFRRVRPAVQRWWVLVLALLLLLPVPWLVHQISVHQISVRPIPVRPVPAPRAGVALQALALAYPDAIRDLRMTAQGWVVRFRDGTLEACQDGLNLSFEKRVKRADLASVLSQPYPFGRVEVPVPSGQEAGRIRNYSLLRQAYGATRDEVRANLDAVDFFGDAIFFNRRNGAAAALRAVTAEIRADPELSAYARRIAGVHTGRIRTGAGAGLYKGVYASGWNWRVIAATRRLSPHSFGIAFDLNNPFTPQPKYWLWSQRKRANILRERAAVESVPWRLVEIFERHGFIWGGKWHHFDTMHFEYRPEFRLAAGGAVRNPLATAPGKTENDAQVR